MGDANVVDEGRPDPLRRPSSGLPPGPGTSARSVPPVRWMDDGARLAITIWGSSRAPTVVTGARVEGQRLSLTGAVRNPGAGR